MLTGCTRGYSRYSAHPQQREGDAVYIGLGTLVLIIILVLLFA